MQKSDILPERVALYHEIEAEYYADLKMQGVQFSHIPVDEEARATSISNLRARGALVRNGGASISINSLSSACVACTGDKGSKTFLLSLRCNRHCYFCFNPNQSNYEKQMHELNDWRAELDQFDALGTPATHIALTGGEPLLHKAEAVAFFEEVRERYPDAHTRLYTTGDDLDRALFKALNKALLTEIRFSIKMDDPPAVITQTLEHIALARDYIPSVMVEMPIIPGSGQAMRSLLDELDALGIYGINLLEFCFPRYNWTEFEKRGFKVKNPPFPVLYDYMYAGGLPIFGSEELALELLTYALDQDMKMGVHYCSLENKHRDEIYGLNVSYATAFKSYYLDPEDFFLKTLVAFDEDAALLRQELLQAQIPFEIDSEDGTVQFNPVYFEQVIDLDIALYCSYNIVVQHEDGAALRELQLVELIM